MTELPTTIEWTDTGSISANIVEAVADAKGVGPTDLETRLYDIVDPDAIERLFDDDTDNGRRLTITFAGCTVVVRGDGFVFVTDEAEDLRSPPVVGQSADGARRATDIRE